MRNYRRLVLIVSFCASMLFTLLPIAGRSAAAAAQADNCTLKDAALIGTNDGANCLDASGWTLYKLDSSLSAVSLRDLAVCPDGQLLIPDFFGVSLYDGQKLTKLPKPSGSLGTKAACGGPNSIWVTGLTQDLLGFDGTNWTLYKSKDIFGSKPLIGTVEALAVSADGKSVWAASSDNIAHFNGTGWDIYENGKGLNKDYRFSSLAFDSKGQLWAGFSGGILKFDGKVFTAYENSKVNSNALAFDSTGNAWVGTNSDGLFKFDGKKWTPFGIKEKALTSNRVNTVRVDGQDRVWVGTNWGLNVFDGKTWTVFQMANSDIVDNAVNSLVIVGNGPALPKAVEHKPGTVIGKIIEGRTNVAGTTIELCSEGAPVIFTGKTPCGGYPDARNAKTDDKGEFKIENVPVGRYGFVVQGSDKKWYVFFGADSTVLVKSGETFDMQLINVKSK